VNSSQPAVATTRISRIGEKMVWPRPQLPIHSGAMPPGRGRMTRLMPDSARKPDSATMIGWTRTQITTSAKSNW